MAAKSPEESLNTMSDIIKEQEALKKRFRKKYTESKEAKEAQEQIEAIRKGLDVPYNKAKEIYQKHLEDEFRKKLDELMGRDKKPLFKKNEGIMVNKGGLLKKKKSSKKKKGSSKVYSRGSRKPKYNAG